ncbi:MAG TPA: aldolase/citrate lyase family protein [Ktedonobacterales bacterium]|nr:aldolase/citrate lyase family protein [Ktedonobacterales bacterium]
MAVMRTNRVKEKLRQGEPALGGWLVVPSVATARVMARLGFDWLAVDTEHSAQHAALMAEMIAAIADAGTCAPLVRLPANSVEWYKWALDAGAWGVIVPMVQTREDAERAVAWSKYPPLGTRSVGGVFGPYGFGVTDWASYGPLANEQILVAVQIESTQALEHLDEILSVSGIDVAFVGPNDLHAHLGLPPSSEGAEAAFLDALERIKEGARKHEVALGIFSSNGEAAAVRIREGFRMISVTTDMNSLISAAKEHLLLARK